MNRIAGLFYAGLFLTMLSCDVTNPVDATDDPFPLEVGNRWDLVAVRDGAFMNEVHYEVTGNRIVDGRHQVILSIRYGPDDEPYNDTLEMEENGNVRFSDNSFGGRYLDFSLSDGDTYESGEYMVTVKNPFTLETPRGTYENCIDFYFDVEDCKDEETGFTFAPGIGLVRAYGAWGMDCRLESYILK
ncbi:MAG: hypothetical protein JW863_19770 [Chitinispirillaceae bacterium]|nr:hypothetical protein [Chitinispirillaceae bacterium]